MTTTKPDKAGHQGIRPSRYGNGVQGRGRRRPGHTVMGSQGQHDFSVATGACRRQSARTPTPTQDDSNLVILPSTEPWRVAGADAKASPPPDDNMRRMTNTQPRPMKQARSGVRLSSQVDRAGLGSGDCNTESKGTATASTHTRTQIWFMTLGG